MVKSWPKTPKHWGVGSWSRGGPRLLNIGMLVFAQVLVKGSETLGCWFLVQSRSKTPKHLGFWFLVKCWSKTP